MADNLFDDIFGWLKPKPESAGARQRRLEGQAAWAAMPAKNNFSNWMDGGTVGREREEMRATWAETEAAWRNSPLGRTSVSDLAVDFVRSLCADIERLPATPILVALCDATETILRAEPIGEMEPNWAILDSDIEAAVEVRRMLVRRRRWCLDYPRMKGIVDRQLRSAFLDLVSVLPEGAFSEWTVSSPQGFGVPLIELFEEPALVVGTLLLFPYDDDTLKLDVFLPLRRTLERNLKIASDIPLTEEITDHQAKVVGPPLQKGKTPAELAELYLAGTPFASLMELPVPFTVPDSARFEHCHIIGGTGHGKTQLMQSLIHADLVAAQTDGRSVVVIDSQGDLINKLSRLDLFSLDTPGSLADRLILIDPADVEFPAALNLFDAHLARLADYRPVDRERVLNGVIELYEVFFGALLGAELTQKQGVIFKYLARLMLTIPGATIHTLMQLMEDGKSFKPDMDKLDGSARYFFQTEFFHPGFTATKKQILRRLWGVLSTPAFERMFAQKANKLDLFQALNDGKIILINTAKDLLKEEGSQLFGRFFIALLAQAALERSTLDEDDRTPAFVYVDEAQEYFDERIETILSQARKYKVGLTLAHQTLDQLSPRLRSAIHANTSLKCAGGVSARDARALADELHTSSDFIESMRRRGGRTEFAVWLKHLTAHAVRLSVPLGFVESQPILTEEEFSEVIDANRARYCGTLDEVLSADFQAPSARDEFAAQARGTEPPPTPTAASERRQREEPSIERSGPRPTPAPRPEPTPGKGGSQHKYLQQLIKQLAEERGLRAVIEEAVPGGQVDVGLHQGDLSVACEISVTSTPEYEAQNLAKCLGAGFSRIWAIAPDAKRRRAIKQAAEARLGPDDVGRVEFLTTEEMIEALDALSVPEPEEKVVKGYRVKTTRKAISPTEAKDRRANIARILSQSIRDADR
jgi:hypothetical protein